MDLENTVTNREFDAFKKTVWEYYVTHKRSFPWRETYDPYFITLSEVMLQQTQTERVVTKYLAFVGAFPTVGALAAACQQEVLSCWQGLGYNRRGVYLKKLAEMVVFQFQGEFPKTVAELDSLPGIGYATACAIATYSYLMPTAFIETNIRTVFIHHFFSESEPVLDRHILPLVERAAIGENPREWYYALMDYGVYLKKTVPNPSRRSAHYAKQSKFAGSDRKLRGELLRYVLDKKSLPQGLLYSDFVHEKDRIDRVLDGMLKDGMLKLTDGIIFVE
jgi:A/G-specific adenine glycosylase